VTSCDAINSQKAYLPSGEGGWAQLSASQHSFIRTGSVKLIGGSGGFGMNASVDGHIGYGSAIFDGK